MTRYHINPKTGNPNKCSAKEGNCPFKSEAGTEATHYESPDAARAGYEQEMEAKAVAAKEAKAAADELNWPTPKADAIAEAEALGYTVEPKSKLLGIRGETDGHRWEITVRKGDVYANQSFKNSFGTSLRINSRWPIEENGTVTRDIEFSDFGRQFTVAEAEEHFKDMESIVKNSPGFVNKVNDAIDAAEKLYGEPNKKYFKGMYSKLDALPPVGPTRSGVAQPFKVTGESAYKTISTEQAARWSDRSDSDASVYMGIRGEAMTSVSLSSSSNMDQDGYQERIGRLKDAIVTARAMEAELEKYPKPPKL